jgi:hypothetical protein
LVVAEAVLYTDDNPERVNQETAMGDEQAVTYHRFVKTTPKPSATKNNRGELELPPPLPVEPVGVADGDEVAVVVGMMSTTVYSGGMRN